MAEEIKTDNMAFSKLHFYSYGYAVYDIELDTDIIEVYPIEKLASFGKDLQKVETISVTVPGTEQNESITLTKTGTIRAKWLSHGQYNRLTPPTICKGEIVELYRFSNADIFYWETMKNNPKLRKQEKIIHAISAKTEIDPDETIENMVYVDYDTFNRYVKFHTPDANGEFTTYDIVVDMLNGTITLVDGEENSITLDSQKGSLTSLINTLIESQTVTYNVTVTDTINLKADNVVNVTAPTVNIEATNVNIKASAQVDIQTSLFTANG